MITRFMSSPVQTVPLHYSNMFPFFTLDGVVEWFSQLVPQRVEPSNRTTPLYTTNGIPGKKSKVNKLQCDCMYIIIYVSNITKLQYVKYKQNICF